MRKILLFVFTLVFVLPFSLFSQDFNDPYSSYGIGRIQDMDFTHLSAIEPLGITHQGQASYSLQNPASYSSVRYTTFNIGMEGRFFRHTRNNVSYEDNRIGFGYLALGFPVMKNIGWGASFGLVPVSQMGYQYKFNPQSDLDYTVENSGTGGLSKFYLGNSVRLFEGLSLGFNAAYIFGTLDRSTSYQFNYTERYLSSRKNLNQSVGDFIFEGGLQYNYSLSEDVSLIFGASARLPRKISITRKEEVFTYPNVGGFETLMQRGLVDTVNIKEDKNGTINFPGDYKATIELRNKNSWRVGVGVHYAKWSKMTIFSEDQNLSDAYEVSLAGEIIPDNEALSSYWERINYRLGIKYANTYLKPLGEPLKRYAVDIGFGFPLNRQQSNINLSLSAGTLGENKNNLFKETFFSFQLGFTLNEKWFIERKIK